MIALITMTGARPEQFDICAKWMKRQTYKGRVTWVIVDDALPVSTDCVKSKFKKDWSIIKVYPDPKWQVGQNTQARNIAAGIAEVKKLKGVKYIFIIEDDDYYKANYLDRMVERMEGYDLGGETHTVYYNVVSRRYHMNENKGWSSLFQTAFTPKVIPILERCYTEKFIDLKLFASVKNKLLFRDGNLGIGIKGMAGRAGIGAGHERMTMTPDYNTSVLTAMIGSDAEVYKPFYSPIPTNVKPKPIPNVNINNLPI
jgi:hypothetical protein